MFEDAAEFALGMRLAVDKQSQHARELLPRIADKVGAELVASILGADQATEGGIRAQRKRVAELKQRLTTVDDPTVRQLSPIVDALVKKSIWGMGGDGWAYDIGYGGLDHVLATGRDINLLVLDTQVYSNTGGQASKATPRAAIAKFAANGKAQPKKDLGLMAMAYGYVYVASVAFGASDQQTLQAFLEAESYEGPSLVLAYSSCIAHGYDMAQSLRQQQLAVQSGAWPLFRFHPVLAAQGKNPLTIDSKAPSVPIAEWAYNETRFSALARGDKQHADELLALAAGDAKRRWSMYSQLASLHYEPKADDGDAQ